MAFLAHSLLPLLTNKSLSKFSLFSIRVVKEYGGLVMEELIEKDNRQTGHDDREKLILEAIANFVLNNLARYERFVKQNGEVYGNISKGQHRRAG